MSEQDVTQSGQLFKGWPALEKILGVLSIILLIGLTALTCVDIVARWFDAPISGAFELTQMMLAGLIYAALPLTTAAREHVEVELLSVALGKVTDSFFHIIGHVISIAVLSVLGWRLWLHADRLAHDGAVTDSLALPFAPIGYFASISCTLSAIVVLVALFVKRPKE
ncbi:MAG: TRAP transporter small permease [Pseudomonas marincola]